MLLIIITLIIILNYNDSIIWSIITWLENYISTLDP